MACDHARLIAPNCARVHCFDPRTMTGCVAQQALEWRRRLCKGERLGAWRKQRADLANEGAELGILGREG